MASSPPFGMEDQTDEDFFDKLVNDDDFNVVSSLKSGLGLGLKLGGENEVDEANVFGNLSKGDEGVGKTGFEVPSGFGEECKEEESSAHKGLTATELIELAGKFSDDVGKLDYSDKGAVMVSDLAGKISDDVNILDKGDKGTVMGADSAASKGDKLGNSGIKEVQWSAFNTDVLQNGVTDSDIFGEFGEREKIDESLACESNVVYGSDEHNSAYLDGSQSYGQYQEGQVNAAESVYSADGQDVNSTEYWEKLYPGWKYDQITGQWYQVNGYDATTSVEGRFDTAVCDETTEVSYLQQTFQSGVGTIAQSGTTESVTSWNQTSRMGQATEMASNWNQVSQTTDSTESVSNWNQVPTSNNGYPSHMYFDPQYPGWYYDTIAQEWRSLDTYIPSTQSAVQSENHLNQNGVYG